MEGFPNVNYWFPAIFGGLGEHKVRPYGSAKIAPNLTLDSNALFGGAAAPRRGGKGEALSPTDDFKTALGQLGELLHFRGRFVIILQEF